MNGTISNAMASAMDPDAIARALASIPPEPIGAWMRKQGFPPEHCMLVLPESMRHLLGGGMPPDYVHFSKIVHTPVLARHVEVVPLPWRDV